MHICVGQKKENPRTLTHFLFSLLLEKSLFFYCVNTYLLTRRESEENTQGCEIVSPTAKHSGVISSSSVISEVRWVHLYGIGTRSWVVSVVVAFAVSASFRYLSSAVRLSKPLSLVRSYFLLFYQSGELIRTIWRLARRCLCVCDICSSSYLCDWIKGIFLISAILNKWSSQACFSNLISWIIIKVTFIRLLHRLQRGKLLQINSYKQRLLFFFANN